MLIFAFMCIGVLSASAMRERVVLRSRPSIPLWYGSLSTKKSTLMGVGGGEMPNNDQ